MNDLITLIVIAYICLSLIALIGMFFTIKHYKEDRDELQKILNNHDGSR